MPVVSSQGRLRPAAFSYTTRTGASRAQLLCLELGRLAATRRGGCVIAVASVLFFPRRELSARLPDGVCATRKFGERSRPLLISSLVRLSLGTNCLAPFLGSAPVSFRTAARWWLCATLECCTALSAPEFRRAKGFGRPKNQKAAGGQKTTARLRASHSGSREHADS